jgi:hypothetical protein
MPAILPEIREMQRVAHRAGVTEKRQQLARIGKTRGR